MRAIVLGNKTTVHKLIAALAGRDNEVVSLSGVYEVITLMKREKFDLVVVDGSGEKTATLCHHVREFEGVPVALMIGQKQPDWKELHSLGVDGYIPQKANGAELAARLQAVVRRCSSGRDVRAPEQKRNINESSIRTLCTINSGAG